MCWNSTDFEPGHYIAIDRCSESIIVAFRGTFHIKDALSDLVATSVPFMVRLFGCSARYFVSTLHSRMQKGGAAHGGIMQCATRKMANIRPILEELVLVRPPATRGPCSTLIGPVSNTQDTKSSSQDIPLGPVLHRSAL